MQHTKNQNLLILCDDITVVGGVERVVSNFTNALTISNKVATTNAHTSNEATVNATTLATNIGGGGRRNTIHIVSIYRANKTLPYNLDSSINLHFLHNHSQKHKPNALAKIFHKIKILLYKLGIFILTKKLHKTREIHRIELNLQINKIAKRLNANIIIDNTWESLHPYFKAQGITYIKAIHSDIAHCGIVKQGNPRYDGNPKDFDLLILLSSRELSIWQTYHHNITVIPNFIPQIPSISTDYSQKIILSVGRMDKGDKGFLRLIDIWKMVQTFRHSERSTKCGAKNPKETKEALGFVDSSVASLPQNDGFGLDCHENPNGFSRNDDTNNLCGSIVEIKSGLCEPSNADRTDSPSRKRGEALPDFSPQDNAQWKLVIVGDGIMKSEIESKINALNLQDSIILKPFTKDIESEYLSASVYAMSSLCEGFPMVLIEASSYGLPCIAFDIATGPSDIIEHNKSGFLIKDNELEAYAKHLLMLMSDESMRERFGSEAKRLVGERFSKEVVMEKWRELFENKS